VLSLVAHHRLACAAHSLARYGDPVLAHADLRTVRMLRCLLHPEGLLFLSLPVGPDAIAFNTMRRYGPTRLPLVLAGWQLAGKYGWDRSLLTAAAPWQRRAEVVFVLRPGA
jgi:hypothetical protein